MGVLAFSALIRVVPLGVASPRFFHLDEWYDAQAAERMATRHDPHPHRFDNPALYTYAVALLYPAVALTFGLALGPAARSWVPYLAGRLVSAGCGVLGVWLVYRLARRLMSDRGALVAALILATMPLHVRFSHLAKADVTMAMWVALTTLLAWRIAEEPTRRLYVLAGLCGGFAASTKYQGAIVCVAILFAHLAARGERPWHRRLLGPNLWLAAACSLVGFALTSPFTFIDFGGFVEGFRANYSFIVAGQPAERAMRPGALVEFGGEALVWIGAVPLALAVAGGVLWWGRNRRALVVVGSVVVAYAALISGWAFRQAHYLMPAVPAVAVLAAVPLTHLWPRRRRLALALAAATFAPALALSAREVVRLWRPDTRKLAERWLARHVVPRSAAVILRDADSLREDAQGRLLIKSPSHDRTRSFYEQVGRRYLKEHGITHFALSDAVASTRGMPPEAARRKTQARRELLARGQRLVRIPSGWWRQGPAIEIHQVKRELLDQFARERERAWQDLRARIVRIEAELASHPGDAERHMQVGKLLTELARRGPGHAVREAWRRAESHFLAAARTHRRPGEALYNLGCLHLDAAILLAALGEGGAERARHFERAVAAFRKAIERDPQQADYYFNLACALWCGPDPAKPAEALARRQEANALYRKAAELSPGIRVPQLGRPGHEIAAIVERGAQPMH